MQRISAHLPAAIKHLRWAYLSLIALLASMVSTSAPSWLTASARQALDAASVEQDRACTALAPVAPLLGAGQVHALAQQVEKGDPRVI